jgi:hypothetical protein
MRTVILLRIPATRGQVNCRGCATWKRTPARFPDKAARSRAYGYASQKTLLWGSLASCGRLAIGQLAPSGEKAAVSNRRSGCQLAPRRGQLFHLYVAHRIAGPIITRGPLLNAQSRNADSLPNRTLHHGSAFAHQFVGCGNSGFAAELTTESTIDISIRRSAQRADFLVPTSAMLEDLCETRRPSKPN